MAKDKSAKERKRKARKKQERLRSEARRLEANRSIRLLFDAVADGSAQGWAHIFSVRPGPEPVPMALPAYYEQFDSILSTRCEDQVSPPREIMMRLRDKVRSGPRCELNGIAFMVYEDGNVHPGPLPDSVFWASQDPLFWLRDDLARTNGDSNPLAVFWVLEWPLGDVPVTAVIGLDPSENLAVWFVDNSDSSEDEPWFPAAFPQGILEIGRQCADDKKDICSDPGLRRALEATGALAEDAPMVNLDASDERVVSAVNLVREVQLGLVRSLYIAAFDSFMSEEITSRLSDAAAKIPELSREKDKLEARLRNVSRELELARSTFSRQASAAPAPTQPPILSLQERIDAIFAE